MPMGGAGGIRRATGSHRLQCCAALALVVLLPVPAGVVEAQNALRGSVPATRLAWQDTGYVDAVIWLGIEGGPSEVLPALARDSILLLPLRQYFEMIEIRIAAMALRDSAVAMLEPGHVPLLFRPAEHVLARGGQAVRHDTLDVVWWDGDLFVATGLLDRLLGTSTGIEWEKLTALVGRTAGLPVVQRVRRERRRVLLAGRPAAASALDLPLRERAVDGAVMTWSLAAARRGPSDQVSLNLGLGAGLMGGSVEIRPELYSGAGGSDFELRGTWTRVWADSRSIAKVQVGDMLSGGRRSRLIRGVSITNAPFIRSSEFDVEHLAGRVPEGWEVELYDGSRLLAYADPDALGAFRVPLQLRYGQNPFELVMYGPAGEQVRQKRSVRVPFSRIPKGRLEYLVASGTCRYDPCDGLMSADLRYGLSSHVTLQGGWDVIMEDVGGTLWQPYAVVSASPLPAVGVSGELVVNGHVRAAANYEPTMDFRVEATHTRFSAAGARFVGTAFETNRSEATLYWRPQGERGSTLLQGTGVLSSGPGLSRSLGRLAATRRFGAMNYSLGMLLDGSRYAAAAGQRRFAVDLGADAVLLVPWRLLRMSSVQGQAAIEPSRGLTALRATLGRQLTRTLRVDGGIGWFRDAGATLELGFNTTRQGPRIGTRSRMSTRTGTDALVFGSGSLAWDPRTQLLRLGDESDLGRGGISGVLFRDDNGNGRRDRNEPGLAGIPVLVGGWAAETDSMGRFAAWGMYPSVPLQIEVDSLSFPDPQLLLPAQVLRVRPAPNSFGAVEVPVVVGAEVSGFVVFRDQGLAGARVVLREMSTGAEIVIITFNDGAFYRGAVPPGEYEVTLADEDLERLGALAPPLAVLVPPGAGEKRYPNLEIRLEARQ